MASNKHEREFGKNILKNQGYQNIQEIQEGDEPSEFWKLLGGKTEYLL
jgi:hypothetical protein